MSAELTGAPRRVDAITNSAVARPLFRTIVADDWRRALVRARGLPNSISVQIRRQLACAIARGLVLVDHSQRKDVV